MKENAMKEMRLNTKVNLSFFLSNEGLDSIERRYEELGNQLVKYRKEYIKIQEQYPPESEYLINQMNRLARLLDVIKQEILVLHERVAKYQRKPQKVNRFKQFLSHVS